ncbi:MAG: hypothetical protein AAFO99_02525 [Bacteroidota bacterium]
MKNGILSILISLFGVTLIIVMNNKTYELFVSELARLNPNGLADGQNIPEIQTDIGFGIVVGLLALFFAFKQFNEKKWFGILVGFLAILLIYFDFLPFWKFRFGDSTLDINFG